MGMIGGGGNLSSTQKALIFAIIIMLLLPTLIIIYCPGQAVNVDRDELFDGYYRMTGQEASSKTSIWALTGIYEPVIEGQPWGETPDGWLYSSRLDSYTPSQYDGTPESYNVYRDSNGVYRYYQDSADYDPDKNTGHMGKYTYNTNTQQWEAREDYDGDLYTAVNFDVEQKSSIFFSENNKTVNDDGTFYYYYTGLRMSFQPISNYNILDSNGNKIPVIATTTSCSLIWYQWYTSSGVAGALVLSGSSGGTSYINGSQIVSAFNSVTSTASFDLVFNGGIVITAHIRIDPYYLTTKTVQECYDEGFWSIMLTSESADASAYTGTDYSVSPTKIMTTMIDLLTFDYNDYSMSDTMGMVCSIVFVLPLYILLISLCLEYAYLWILVGLLTAVESLNFFNIL